MVAPLFKDMVAPRKEALQLATRLSLSGPCIDVVSTAFTELVHTRMILRNAGPYAYTMKLDTLIGKGNYGHVSSAAG